MFLTKVIICPRCGYSGGGGVVQKYLLLPTDEIFYWCNECSTIWTDISQLKQKIKSQLFDSEYFEQRNLDKNRPRRASGYSSTFIPKQTFLHLL